MNHPLFSEKDRKHYDCEQCRTEKEHLQLVGMQQAYMRNAAIAEHPDALNGTYHNKIYRAAVRDIENIINK